MSKISKTYEDIRYKAAKGRGRITALVSIFNTVDLVGDRVMPGAFLKSLEEWQLSGAPIPMVFAHSWSDIDAHVGSWDPLLARETDEGLELTGQIDDDPAGQKLFRILAEGRVRAMSFAYDTVREKRAPDSANELLELRIIEAGPCLRGAHPDARLVDLKTAIDARPKPLPRGKFIDLGGELVPVDTDLAAHLLAKGYDPELVATALGKPTPQEIAAEARKAAAEKELAAFHAANEALALGGALPSEAERAARISDQVERERAERAARASDRGDDGDSMFHADTGASR